MNKQRIIKLINEGKTLYDVCNDYTLEKSDRLEFENWSFYRLTTDGTLIHKKCKEIHYKIV